MNYNIVANQASIDTTMAALTAKGFLVDFVQTKSEALKKIIQHIPQGASVMNGSSKTLEQIGYTDYLKEGNHGWTDLHHGITSENDPIKRTQLRKMAITSDFYLGSVHAITEDGNFIVASNSGSQLPHIVFTSPNVILIVGTQKIVPTLTEGVIRLENYVIPLEDEHMKQLYNIGTHLNSILIIKGINPRLQRQIRIIFVNESVGF